MDISGKTKIWRKDVETKDGGTFPKYSIAISSRREDGTYASVYIPLKFARRANAPEKITNGAEAEIKGFLTVNERPSKDGKIKEVMAMVMSVEFNEDTDASDSFEQLEEDLPFN